jgi:hypothetical protein
MRKLMILPQADVQFRESPESLRSRLTGTGVVRGPKVDGTATYEYSNQ